MVAMTQNRLFTLASAYQVQFAQVPLAYIDPTGAQVTPAFLDSIRRYGVIEPVGLGLVPSGDDEPLYQIIFGARRVAAARELELETVPAMVYSGEWRTHRAEIALSENHHRHENVPLTVDLLEGYGREGKTLEDIGRSTGIAMPTLKRYARLLGLNQELRWALADGRMKPSVAAEAVKLGATQQSELAAQSDGGPITKRMVDSVREAGQHATMQALDLQLGGVVQLPWEAEARSLIARLLQIIPADKAGWEARQALDGLSSVLFSEKTDA